MNFTPSLLEQQVRRVRRRLFLKTLLDALSWCWAVALLLSAAWVLAEPHLLGKVDSWLRWAVAGGTVGLGALTALLIAWFASPSPLKAALALDAAFNLKERVTTSLGLNDREAITDAGQALLTDVNNRLAPLRVADRFPLRLSWSAVAVPVGLVLLVLLAAFYHPNLGALQANDNNKPLTDDPDAKQAIEKKKKELLQPPDEKKGDPRQRLPDLMKLEDERDLLAKEPTDTKEQGKEFIKKTADLEQRMQDADRQIAERNNAMRERFNQDERLNPERLKSKKKDGPGKDLQQGMKAGDSKMADDAMDRISKMLDPEQQKRLAEKFDKVKDKLGDKGLTKEEKDRLQKEMDKLKDELLNDEFRKDIQEALRELEEALDKLAEPEKQEKQLQEKIDKIDEERKKAEEKVKEREDELKKAQEKAKEQEKKAAQEKDPEEKKKAEDELKKAKEEVEQKKKEEKEAQADKKQAERELEKKRQELADMKKNNEQMGDKMKQDVKDLAKELGECEKAMQDGKDGDAAKKMQEAREKLKQMMGDAERQNLLKQIRQLQMARQAVCDAMNKEDGGKGNGNGPADQNDGGVASGQRPLAKEGKTEKFETTAPSELSKGPLRITDFLDGPGGERGSRGPVQMTDDLRIRAAQEGASALTRQRLDRPGDTERVREYFDNMRGPEKNKPKP